MYIITLFKFMNSACEMGPTNSFYRPTSGLMQIVHFDWLRYERTRVAKSMTLSFVLFPNKYFFNLHLLTLLLPFLSD